MVSGRKVSRKVSLILIGIRVGVCIMVALLRCIQRLELIDSSTSCPGEPDNLVIRIGFCGKSNPGFIWMLGLHILARSHVSIRRKRHSYRWYRSPALINFGYWQTKVSALDPASSEVHWTLFRLPVKLHCEARRVTFTRRDLLENVRTGLQFREEHAPYTLHYSCNPSFPDHTTKNSIAWAMAYTHLCTQT